MEKHIVRLVDVFFAHLYKIAGELYTMINIEKYLS
jgi:hypothetical protein